MGAETLQPCLAFVPPGPAAQLRPDVLNLLPQEARRAIATARLQFHDRRRHFDHTGVEIDRAAGRELEGTPSARKHLPSNQPLRRAKDCFRPPPNAVDNETELRLQTDDRARRRKMNAPAG